MYQHALMTDDSRILVVTGSGYGTALACRRLSDRQVTSVDVDPYLVEAATDRLAGIGLRPQMGVCDITGPLPGRFDRIIATVSVPGIPASWLAALNPGGRLVTTIADTGLVITADKTDDGGAVGQVESEGAGFMSARHDDDYPPEEEALFNDIRDRAADAVTTSPYPVIRVQDGWELWSTFSLQVPGVQHRFSSDDGGRDTAWMVHPDGSWARATAYPGEPAKVHQGGPRRLWDELDRIRGRWLVAGHLNTYGAKVTITPEGVTTLTRGGWTATL
jgi:protein-L-isoaspartate O-methyltransferase